MNGDLAVYLKFVGVDLRTSENKEDQERRLKCEEIIDLIESKIFQRKANESELKLPSTVSTKHIINQQNDEKNKLSEDELLESRGSINNDTKTNSTATSKLNHDENVYNVIIVGSMGQGKSTFINALSN